MVASDFSEPPESSQLERLEEIAEEVLPQGLLEVGSGRPYAILITYGNGSGVLTYALTHPCPYISQRTRSRRRVFRGLEHGRVGIRL